MRFRGDLYEGGQLRLSGIGGDIQRRARGAGGPIDVSGSFEVAKGPGHVPLPGNIYELRLDDGTATAIIIEAINDKGNNHAIRFREN